MGKRRNYRVNADSWSHLRDILVGTPEDFNTDSATLKGRQVAKYESRVGWLPPRIRDDFMYASYADRIEYVIWSYGTPIAWRYRNGEWEMPDVRYSVTTSKHQGKVRTAITDIRMWKGE